MSAKKIGISGKIIHSQAREVIANVLEFMKKEASGEIAIPVANFKQRLIMATGISEKTYRNICKESIKVQTQPSGFFPSPIKTKEKKSFPDSYREGQLASIRDVIYNYYIIEKRRPSLKCMYILV